MFELYDLRVSHRHEPLGLDAPPSFSWKLHGDENSVKQSAYQIYIESQSAEI